MVPELTVKCHIACGGNYRHSTRVVPKSGRISLIFHNGPVQFKSARSTRSHVHQIALRRVRPGSCSVLLIFSAGWGRENRNPCPSRQPRYHKSASCSRVSIPSATTSMPSTRASSTMVRTICSAWSPSVMREHERAVDLQHVERECMQVVQRAVAGAEVVHEE